MDRTPSDLSRVINDLQRDLEELKAAQMNIQVTTGMIADGAVTEPKIQPELLAIIGSYSESEVATPFTWVDGKTIYKKTVYISALPDSTSASTQHNISDIDRVINVQALWYSSSNHANAYQYVGGTSAGTLSSNQALVEVTRTAVIIKTGWNRSGCDSYITIFYTKTQ